MFSGHLEWLSFCFFFLFEENDSIISHVGLVTLEGSLYMIVHMSSVGRWLSSRFEVLKSRWSVAINKFSKFFISVNFEFVLSQSISSELSIFSHVYYFEIFTVLAQMDKAF